MHWTFLGVSETPEAGAAFALTCRCLRSELPHSSNVCGVLRCIEIQASNAHQHTTTHFEVLKLLAVELLVSELLPTSLSGACVKLQVSRCATQYCTTVADHGVTLGKVIVELHFAEGRGKDLRIASCTRHQLALLADAGYNTCNQSEEHLRLLLATCIAHLHASALATLGAGLRCRTWKGSRMLSNVMETPWDNSKHHHGVGSASPTCNLKYSTQAQWDVVGLQKHGASPGRLG